MVDRGRAFSLFAIASSTGSSVTKVSVFSNVVASKNGFSSNFGGGEDGGVPWAGGGIECEIVSSKGWHWGSGG